MRANESEYIPEVENGMEIEFRPVVSYYDVFIMEETKY